MGSETGVVDIEENRVMEKGRLGPGQMLAVDLFQNKLLSDTGIAAIAGTSFGEFGEGYLRFSCASSEESIKKAIEKLALFLSKL